MRYLALACDYDGTLARDGRVEGETADALRRLRTSGRRVILVTGRMLGDLLEAFPQIGLCDAAVVENGAVLYQPSSRQSEVLAAAPPPFFMSELRRRGVDRLAVGRVIVATAEAYRSVVLDTIRALRLDLQPSFNKGALMVLPAGVNKGTGLAAALRQLGLSAHQVVAIGDAENDEALLDICGRGVAVANALPDLKAGADFVTQGSYGAGVVEVIDALLGDDLRSRRDVEP